jgi:AraC family transcriptional regulator
MAIAARKLFSSTLVTLSDFTCDMPKSGCGCEQCGARSSITIIRRGVHAYHARGETVLAEPGLGLLYRGGESYRLSHPYDRAVPDRSTCIEFGPTLLDEVFGSHPLSRDLGTHLSPGSMTLNLRVMSAIAANKNDRLAGEEAVLSLVRAIASNFNLFTDDRPGSTVARRRVARARAFIAEAPEANHSLEDVAAAAACSPYHFARLFKRHTGMTIRDYRRRLRLAIALQELADGATDLSALAARLGFSDHSHMTGSFRSAFGRTPSSLREEMRGSGLRQLSKFFQAAAGSSP